MDAQIQRELAEKKEINVDWQAEELLQKTNHQGLICIFFHSANTALFNQ